MSTTLTGTLNTLIGSVPGKSYVRMWLRGCNGNQPRVAGVAVIAPSQGEVFYWDFVPDNAGLVSGSLYSNDIDVEAGGQVGVTWYGVQWFYNGKPGPEIPVTALDGQTLNLNNFTPLVSNPTYSQFDINVLIATTLSSPPLIGNVTPNDADFTSVGVQIDPWPSFSVIAPQWNGTYKPAPVEISQFTALAANQTPIAPLTVLSFGDQYSLTGGDESNASSSIKAFMLGKNSGATGGFNLGPAAIMGVASSLDVGAGAYGIQGFGNLNDSDVTTFAGGAWFMASDNGNPGFIHGLEVDVSKTYASHSGNVVGMSVANYGANGGGSPAGTVDGDIGLRNFGFGIGFLWSAFQSTISANAIAYCVEGNSPTNDANTTLFGGFATPNPFKNGISFAGMSFTNAAIDGAGGGSPCKNLSFTGPTSGNNLSALDEQSQSGAITGTGAPATVFTYTIPANSIAVGKGLKIRIGCTHSGVVSVTYDLKLNGQTVASVASSAASVLFDYACVVASSSTGSFSGLVGFDGAVSAYVTGVTGLAFGSNQVLSLTFTVAATDSVAPIMWMIEVIQ